MVIYGMFGWFHDDLIMGIYGKFMMIYNNYDDLWHDDSWFIGDFWWFMACLIMFVWFWRVLDGFGWFEALNWHTWSYLYVPCTVLSVEYVRSTSCYKNLHAHHQMALFEIVYSQIQWSIIIFIISLSKWHSKWLWLEGFSNITHRIHVWYIC